MREKSRWVIVSFLLVAYSCLCGPTLYGGTREMNNVVSLDMKSVKNQADLVLFGNLEIVAQPNEVIGKKRFYENGILGNTFYKINAVEILKGHLPANSFLIVRTNVNSSEGKAPSVESLPYLLFLQKVELDKDAALQNLVFYRLVGNWKGIISLDRTASECRAVDRIAKQYGINIRERLEDFKEAMRYSLKEQGTKAPKKDLNSGAFAVYEGLKLVGDVSQPTTNQTAEGVQQIQGSGEGVSPAKQ